MSSVDRPRPSETGLSNEFRRQISGTVGKLIHTYQHDGGNPITIAGTAFITTAPDGSQHVVTARHVMDPNFPSSLIRESSPLWYQFVAKPFTSVQKTLILPNSGAVLHIPLGETYSHTGNDGADVAVIKMPPEPRLSQKPLTLMTPDELSITPDDGIYYCPGFGFAQPNKSGVVKFRRLEGDPPYKFKFERILDNRPTRRSFTVEQLSTSRLNGLSGGPLLASINGELKVASLFCEEIPPTTEGGLPGFFEEPESFLTEVRLHLVAASRG